MYGLSSSYTIGFLLLLVVFPIIYFIGNTTVHPKSVRLTLLFIIFFIFAAFRAPTVGGDLEYYIPHFNEICGIKEFNQIFDLRTSNFEPGYTIICWLISRISDSSMAFLSITSFLSLIGPFYLCKRFSPWPCLSIFIYFLLGFYTNTFNNVRQSIAISTVFFAIPFLLDNKALRFTLLVSLATSIHFSSAIFFLAYPFSKLHLSIRLLFWGFLVGFVVSIVLGPSIMNLIGPFLKYEEIVGRGEGRGMMFFYVIITCISFFVFKRNETFFNKHLKIVCELFIKFLLIASILQMFAVYFPSIVRLSFFFYIPIICLIPILISSYKSYHKRRLFGAIIMATLFYYMNSFIYSHSSAIDSNFQGVIPYSFNF